ncbi:MAG: hypothetical protein ABFD52_01535 [Acidobacteriota bacterium]
MKLRSALMALAALGAVLPAASAAYAQLPPAAELLPAGFKVVQDLKNGPMTVIVAQKANEGLPQPWAHVNIELKYSVTKWVPDEDATAEDIEGMKELFEETMAQYLDAPQEADKRQPGSPMRYELCGKERYQKGVLTCQRYIERYTGGIGNEKVPDLVTYDLNWMGKSDAGSVAISIFHYGGARETALGWIDAIISRISAKK